MIGKCPRTTYHDWTNRRKAQVMPRPVLGQPDAGVNTSFPVLSFWNSLSSADWRLITGSYVHTLLLLFLFCLFWDFNNNRQIKTNNFHYNNCVRKHFIACCSWWGCGECLFGKSLFRSRRAQLESRLREFPLYIIGLAQQCPMMVHFYTINYIIYSKKRFPFFNLNRLKLVFRVVPLPLAAICSPNRPHCVTI